MNTSSQLGPFDLGERIGKGGMGSVYRARHAGTGVEVALKILPHGGSESARRRFHREVQAQAELTHSGIVYLFEYGTVDAEAARASDELVEGSPYVAMELADAGTLQDHRPLSDWQQVRSILLQVLDALAFAHARDVIHRDLKPENFLVFENEWSGDETGKTVKLADFGLAHPFEDEQDRDLESLRAPAGTPFYMPPEQGRGNWREYGPWTDLYAVGCITWELVCGHPPFHGDNPLSVVLRHEEGDRPPLEPQFPVPEGLETWIHRAMAVDPSDRFRRAADAARLLPEMSRTPADSSDSRDGSTLTGFPNRDLAPTVAPTLAETVPGALVETDPGTGNTERSDDGLEPKPPSKSPSTPGASPPDSLPSDWRTDRTAATPAPLIGTGLGLFGLREVPFVDRGAERDTLWEALRAVVERDAFRVVLLAGEAGAGKSRLANWLTTRAHELGVGHALKAFHAPNGGGRTEGLTGMVRRAFHAWKLSRSRAYEYLRRRLPPLEAGAPYLETDARALTEFLYPTDDEAESVDGPPYHFSSSEQRHALIARLLERFERRRTPILWLDDLQWGSESLDLLEYLTTTVSDPPPALVVGTVRTDLLADRPRTREQLGALADDPRGRRLDLEALETDDQRELLARLLPLDDDVTRRLARRTEGNPLFAVQLLGHWVERGMIEIKPEGFGLADTDETYVPGNIHALWMERLDRLVGIFPTDWAADAVESLEVAAALGQEVDREEWHDVCERSGLTVPTGLVDAMVNRGLADRTPEGWAFAHRLLVDSLERRSRTSDRWKTHHRRCARTLDELYDDFPKETAGRRADHWIEAGELERALGPLRTQRDLAHETGSLRDEREILRRRDDLLDRLGIADGDPRRLENDVLSAARDLLAGVPPESALEAAEDADRRAAAAGETEWRSAASIVIGRCHKRLHAFDDARRAFERALGLADACAAADLEARALFGLGSIHLDSGELTAAVERFRTAAKRFADAGDRYWQLQARLAVIEAHISAGRTSEARNRLADLRATIEEEGYPLLESVCSNQLGELARFDGEFDLARRCYDESLEAARELGQPFAAINALLNLAHVEVATGRFDDCAARLTKIEDELERMQIDEKQHLVGLLHAALAAGTGAWTDFDRHFAPYRDGWPREAGVERDHLWLLEVTGDYAVQADETERARQLWQLGIELAEKLGDEAAVERLEARLP